MSELIPLNAVAGKTDHPARCYVMPGKIVSRRAMDPHGYGSAARGQGEGPRAVQRVCGKADCRGVEWQGGGGRRHTPTSRRIE